MLRVKYLLQILSDNDPETYTKFHRDLVKYLKDNTTMKGHTYRRYRRGVHPIDDLKISWGKAIWEWMQSKFDEKLSGCTDGDARAKLEHEYPLSVLHLFYGIEPATPDFKKRIQAA